MGKFSSDSDDDRRKKYKSSKQARQTEQKPYKRLIDEINQNELRENYWRTDNLTNNRRLFNCDKRRIETHQLLITSLHSQ